MSVLAAVEENVSGSFHDLQQEAAFFGAQSNVLSRLRVAPKETHFMLFVHESTMRGEKFQARKHFAKTSDFF